MAGVGGLASGLISGIGSAVGAHLALGEMNDANSDYQRLMGNGINTQQQGLDQSTAAYSPYTGLASSSANGLSAAINGRQMSDQPSLSGYNVGAYMNPSAQYSTQQAGNALQSSSLAHGGLGGGLGRALSNNANKMAMTNYNSAYQQMLDTNNQRFGQQQQRYANANDYQQQQIANRQNLAQLGLTGMNAGQQLGQGYRNTMSGMYGNWANNAMDLGYNKASLANAATTSATNQMGAGVGSYMGGK